MKDYVILSIETHLFFARIMKEHALFLEAGFPCCEKECIEEADGFRRKFEELLQDVLKIAGGNIHRSVLNSNELITEFTIPAEKKTAALSGIPIDSSISEMTRQLGCSCKPRETVRSTSDTGCPLGIPCETVRSTSDTGCPLGIPCETVRSTSDTGCPTGIQNETRSLYQPVVRINERALKLLHELIHFKEQILCKMNSCQLFTFNYPLLIEHITREARLYRDIVQQLLTNRNVSYQRFYETEEFWNQIMMEHAWFIRGLLDPSETQLIETADDFSKEYARLLDTARRQDCRANDMTKKSLEETLRYRDFKTAGARGILDCQISSVILPLLADHVLREANHYIRVLETGRTR